MAGEIPAAPRPKRGSFHEHEPPLGMENCGGNDSRGASAVERRIRYLMHVCRDAAAHGYDRRAGEPIAGPTSAR